ncbi:MAG: hypothetical protein LBH25_00930 [Fibromonadaceae bacterium]|nr:hypothetical protein [Fibromonadaceae bacterium]
MIVNHKFLLSASLFLAAIFTFSCAGDDEVNPPDYCWSDKDNAFISCSTGSGSNGSREYTEKFIIIESDDYSFAYADTGTANKCKEGGILEKEISGISVYEADYSISNNTLAWEPRKIGRDTLNFKGTSSSLTGTWTRTKNASCKSSGDDDYNEHCSITKAVFTEKTLTLTHSVCPTDILTNGSEEKGWKLKVVDCNAIELSKGSDKVTGKTFKTKYGFSGEMVYKGKTCKFNGRIAQPSYADREKACKDAWNKVQRYEEWDNNDLKWLYDESLKHNSDMASYDNYVKCLCETLPKDFSENPCKD